MSVIATWSMRPAALQIRVAGNRFLLLSAQDSLRIPNLVSLPGRARRGERVVLNVLPAC
ncbi:MAG: hypothetical protein QXU32_08275 [Nitrososphaerales archaeon]